MTVKEHYDQHLSHFYSWMMGDFQIKSNEFKQMLADNFIQPTSSKIALDLGAGHGIQSIPLAEIGFHVLAIDFNQKLLDELKVNAKGLDVKAVNDDIKNIGSYGNKLELVVCCGDTLSHLNNKIEIENFIHDIANSLDKNGKLILSFRDYSSKLTGIERIIPVKNDETKILTCILDYEDEHVNVTDLLYEKTSDGWSQKISSYKKVRLLTTEILQFLKASGMTINTNKVISRMTTIVATKQQ